MMRRGGTLALSWGPSGGVYLERGFCKRLCLGRLAITYVPGVEIDELMHVYVQRDERDEAFKDLAEVAYLSRDAVWTSPRVLAKTALEVAEDRGRRGVA